MKVETEVGEMGEQIIRGILEAWDGLSDAVEGEAFVGEGVAIEIVEMELVAEGVAFVLEGIEFGLCGEEFSELCLELLEPERGRLCLGLECLGLLAEGFGVSGLGELSGEVIVLFLEGLDAF